MAKAKHSLGPWTCVVIDRSEFLVVDSNRTEVALVNRDEASNATSDRAAYANACLMAAAPDLLEALKEIVEHPAAFSDGARRLWSQALDAIAKAEGTGAE